MTQDSDAFIEADGSRLITTCYHWVAEKPRDESSPTKTGSPASSDTGIKPGSGTSSDAEEAPTPASSTQSVNGDASKAQHSTQSDHPALAQVHTAAEATV